MPKGKQFGSRRGRRLRYQAHRRAPIHFFAVNLAAYVIGAPLVGRINDALGAGADPQMLRYGLLLCPAAALLAALLLWLGSRSLERGA